jgi:hypothetical protein
MVETSVGGKRAIVVYDAIFEETPRGVDAIS